MVEPEILSPSEMIAMDILREQITHPLKNTVKSM